MVSRALTLAEVAALPAVTDLVTAGRALGIGRTKAYELARAGQFPCPVIRAGSSWLVPTAGLLAALGLPVPGLGRGAPSSLTGPAERRVDAGPADLPAGPPPRPRPDRPAPPNRRT